MFIRVKGLNEYRRRVGQPVSRKTNRRSMLQSVLLLEADIKKYPRPPRNSTYKRTGTLGRRWTHEVSKSGLVGKVGNKTIYAPFVQSHDMQARIHRGRWQTDVIVLNRNIGKIEKIWKRNMDRALDRR